MILRIKLSRLPWKKITVRLARSQPNAICRNLASWAAFFLSAGISMAQITVDYSAGANLRTVTDPQGIALADGNQVRIGFFPAAFDVSAKAGDLLALQDAWVQYGATAIKTILGQPGRFADSQSSSDSAFDNKKIYFWIFDTSNDAAPTATFSNVDSYGLYSSTLSNWVFPAQGSVPPANIATVNSGEVNQAFYGSVVGASDSGSLKLQAVPEPAVYPVMMGFAAMILVWWKRKQTATR